HDVPVGGEASKASARDATIGGRARRRRTRIAIGIRLPPMRRLAPDQRVARVQDVDIRSGGEVGIQRHPKQAAVPVVVDVGPQVREDRWVRVRDALEDLDDAALLRNEDAAIRRERDRRWLVQATDYDLVLKP